MTPDSSPVSRVRWSRTHRIVRSVYPPIDLFEDIADPKDWDAINSAEAKSNPRLAESIGMLDLVPLERRVGGDGASWAMAPFVHVSLDRPSRFSDGSFGIYYAGDRFEVALFETLYHHSRFMSQTAQEPGWTSEFRELVGSIDAEMHDIRGQAGFRNCLDADSYAASQNLARHLHSAEVNGIVYPSVRYPDGACIAAFWPDVVGIPTQGRHLAYHWDGVRADQVKDLSSGDVFSVEN